MQLPDAPIRVSLFERIRRLISSAVHIHEQDIVGISEAVVTHQFMAETDGFDLVAHVSVIARDDAIAVKLNGRQNLYNGPIQKMLSSHLQREFGQELHVDRFRVQVWSETSPPHRWDFGPPENKELDRLLVGRAVQKGLVPPIGTVFTACATYSLPFVIIRDGLVMGPSPAFPDAIQSVAKLLNPAARVLDPFAGTFISRKVLAEVRPDVEVTALDAVDEHRHPTGYDAFADLPNGHFDLVILDPLYEDLFLYVKNVLPRIDFELLMVQTGEYSDIAWNRAIESLLKKITVPVFNFRKLSRRWGKNVFVGRRHQPNLGQLP